MKTNLTERIAYRTTKQIKKDLKKVADAHEITLSHLSHLLMQYCIEKDIEIKEIDIKLKPK